MMGLLMVAITTVACLAVGLPYAVVLGLIAGVAEFVPNLGVDVQAERDRARRVEHESRQAVTDAEAALPPGNPNFHLVQVALRMQAKQRESARKGEPE